MWAAELTSQVKWRTATYLRTEMKYAVTMSSPQRVGTREGRRKAATMKHLR